MLWASVMLRAIHMVKDIHMLRAMPLLKSTHMLIASNMCKHSVCQWPWKSHMWSMLRAKICLKL